MGDFEKRVHAHEIGGTQTANGVKGLKNMRRAHGSDRLDVGLSVC